MHSCRHFATAALAASLLVLVSGCSSLRFPGVYRVDIEQGNIVTEDAIAKLKPGMTESQVRFVLGSPQVVDPFEPGRWVYLYRLRRGNNQIVESKMVVFLKGGALDHWEGQPLPDSARRRLLQQQPTTPKAAEPAAIPEGG